MIVRYPLQQRIGTGIIVNQPFAVAQHRPPIDLTHRPGSRTQHHISGQVIRHLLFTVDQHAFDTGQGPESGGRDQFIDTKVTGDLLENPALFDQIYFHKLPDPATHQPVIKSLRLHHPFTEKVIGVDIGQLAFLL